MRSVALSVVALGLASAAMAVLPAAGYGDDSLITVYESAVERLRSAYDGLTMTVRVTHYRAAGQEPARQAIEEYSRAGDRIRIVRDIKISDRQSVAAGDRQVRVASPDASFAIRKDEGHPAYTTERIVEFDDSEFSMRLKAKPLYAPFSFLEFTIPRFIKEPSFKLLDVAETKDTETGDPLVKILWECPFDDIRQTGWFALLPEQSWALREYWIQNETAGEPGRALIRCRVDYDGAVRGAPLVSHVRFWQEFHDFASLPANVPVGIPVNIEEYEVLSSSPQGLPKEQFTLEAFGIPNPGSAGSRWVRTILLVNLALVLIGAAVLLWRMSQRSARGERRL